MPTPIATPIATPIVSGLPDPAALGATHWWSAEAGLTVDGSDGVSGWTDQIGGQTLIADAGFRPLLLASSANMNGRSSLQFTRAGGTNMYKTSFPGFTDSSDSGIIGLSRYYPASTEVGTIVRREVQGGVLDVLLERINLGARLRVRAWNPTAAVQLFEEPIPQALGYDVLGTDGTTMFMDGSGYTNSVAGNGGTRSYNLVLVGQGNNCADFELRHLVFFHTTPDLATIDALKAWLAAETT